MTRVDIDLSRFRSVIEGGGKKVRPAAARALTRTTTMARTQMVKVLVPQTGLKNRTITKALRHKAATAASLSATIRSSGGDIRLKFFNPKIVAAAGVSATPWSKRTTYRGVFMRGGRNQSGKAVVGGKTPFERVGSKRLPIRQARSGLFIPEEMVEKASAAAFYNTAARVLPIRLSHELARVFA